jgi:ADP-heptose:LPS heptosyltransferase
MTGPTAFSRFRTKLPFEFGLPTFDARFKQASDGSAQYLTRNDTLLGTLKGAPQIRLFAAEGLDCLPRRQWGGTDFAGKRVLFLLPSAAIGDCVGVHLFLKSFRARWPDAELAVLNSGAATDVFALDPAVTLFPLFISEKQQKRWRTVVDLGEMEGWGGIATSPVDAESVLLAAFGLDPCDALLAGRPVPAAPRIAILPLASSPLRSLPPRLVAALARTLGPVTVLLNNWQGLSRAYEAALRPLLPEGATVLGGFRATGELMGFMASCGYVVLADSGPAHLAKLSATPGTAVYTSAGHEVLQGRFRNLTPWQARYQGEFCAAPCGLAKLRRAADGRVGCMGSLGLPLESLPGLPGEDAALAARLVLETPVPCVKALADEAEAVAEFVMGDMERRRLHPSR